MSTPVHLCVPVLRRYDMLRRMLLSVAAGALLPDVVHIVDNGAKHSDLMGAIAGIKFEYDIRTPLEPAGVAESWNWFIGHTPDERIITNDDMLFDVQSISVLTATAGDLVLGFGFSCYLLRDRCVELIGPFDETISPGYGYYEDCDYAERIRQAHAEGRGIAMVDAQGTGLVHGDGKDGSWTYRGGTPEQIEDHWRRMELAGKNFVRKHGAAPDVLEERWRVRNAIEAAAKQAAPA